MLVLQKWPVFRELSPKNMGTVRELNCCPSRCIPGERPPQVCICHFFSRAFLRLRHQRRSDVRVGMLQPRPSLLRGALTGWQGRGAASVRHRGLRAARALPVQRYTPRQDGAHGVRRRRRLAPRPLEGRTTEFHRAAHVDRAADCIAAGGADARWRASKRNRVAASVLNRPRTSTATTTKQQRRARTSSGYVWCRLRQAAPPTSVWPGWASAPGCASPARVTGLTMVASMACWEWCQSGSPLATTSMWRSSETGTSMFMSARRTLRAGFLADAHDCPLEGQSTGGKHARVCARSPVISKRVEATPINASAWRHRRRPSQAS